MKTQNICFLSLILLATSCANIKYSEYRGHEPVVGKGGSVRTVLGIDFWTDGDPNRRYQVIGSMEYQRKEGMFGGDTDKDLAKAVKEQGGDALIWVQAGHEVTGIDWNSGSLQHTKYAKVLVLKYLP